MADNIKKDLNSGNKELMVFLAEKFDGVDKQLNTLQNQNVSDYQGLADLMADQFEKVFEKLDQKADKSDTDKIYQILATKADKSDTDAVLTRVARLGNKIDDYRAEEIGLKRQVEKHEKWHLATAAKIGIKLRPE
jgi:uncharacterized protein YicC (UPF0701 family)